MRPRPSVRRTSTCFSGPPRARLRSPRSPRSTPIPTACVAPPHPTPPHPTVLRSYCCRPAVLRLQAGSPTVAGRQFHGCRPPAPRLQAGSPTVAGRQPHSCRPAVPRLQAGSPTVAGRQSYGCRPPALLLQAVSAEWLRRKLEGEWLPRFETPRRSQLAGESLTLYTLHTHAAAAWVRAVWRYGKQ